MATWLITLCLVAQPSRLRVRAASRRAVQQTEMGFA
jgi:hypothetical protein